MSMYEKHLSKQEIDTLLARRADGSLVEAWRQLARQVRDLMNRGTSPESSAAQESAWR